MKKLSFINRIIFLINNIFAILLLLSFFVPYIKPTSFFLAPLIALIVPALLLINLLFVCYWILIGFKKQFLLSTFVLILGYFIASPIYKFSSDITNTSNNKLTILSYNIRKFNSKGWIADKHIPQKISEFIANENPDILALQEYKNNANFTIDYPYYYQPKISKKVSSGLSLYSKYQIIHQGFLENSKAFNRIIFIDILKNNDTLRIYNMHLQSLGLEPDEDLLGHKSSKGLIKRLNYSFKQQQEQITIINQEIAKSKYPTILAGDMNNTPYSWSYKDLKNDFKDSFLEAGSGFGKTYDFKGFPLRIDYIFVDNRLKVNQHKNYTIKYSDHYPILATVSF